jgi:hypothetical protein
MFKNKKPLIQFISTIDGLQDIPECVPKPTKAYLPDWWKAVPGGLNDSIKVCPSFPDFFSQGYIVPMWMDSGLMYTKDADFPQITASKGNVFPKWEYHKNHQFMQFVDPYTQGSPGQFVFKAVSPWRIITPPGYSVLQLPLFYHFNKDFSVMPGIIDTDIHHEINQQILYHGNGEYVEILRGTPLAMYIPFKREKYDVTFRYQTPEDMKLFSKQFVNLMGKFIGNGPYRQLQRLRDKNL